MKQIAEKHKGHEFARYYETDEGKQFRVSVNYELGGMSYFTGEVGKRGYFLSVVPVSIDVKDGRIMTETFTMFVGQKFFLEPAKMFSPKKLAALGENRARDVDVRASEMLKSQGAI